MCTILLLEDEKIIQEGFRSMIEDIELDMKLTVCENLTEYDRCISDPDVSSSIRVLVFDLANNSEEIKAKTFKAEDYIKDNYKRNRIPIFIHSGYLAELEEYENFGTVFKVEKSANSIEIICNRIKLFYNSGFLDIFRNHGLLENKLFILLHEAFVNQFKGEEIELILKSIASKDEGDVKARTIEVFERIALRALFENISHEKKGNNDSIEEIQLNAIEHYFRRTTSFKYWTGDILCNKENNDLSIVLTPRCNISNQNFDNLLLCKIKKFTPDEIQEFTKRKGIEKLRRKIIDDVTRTGDRFRFLPKTPQFEGGTIDFNLHFVETEEVLDDMYVRLISLSDNLTNEVIRKFTSYLLRFGLTNTDIYESIYYLNND